MMFTSLVRRVHFKQIVLTERPTLFPLAPNRSRIIHTSPQFVDNCPEPEFDTGCTYCQPAYPISKPVKTGTPLAGTAPSIGKHVVVSTGHADWPSKTETDPRSFEASVKRLLLNGIARDPDFNFMVTSVSLPPETRPGEEAWSISLYPDRLHFPRVPYDRVSDFVKKYLIPSRSHEVNDIESILEMKSVESPLVLVCGHASRDARCGIAGPMIVQEFEKVLRIKNLLYSSHNPAGVRVALASHVGGHAYAGNVIILKGATSVWYGLVSPRHVQGIVKASIEGDTIIKELYRGSGVPQGI